MGGFIINGELKLREKSKWEKYKVIRGSYEKERKLAEKGAINFHTHPINEFAQESAQDMLASYYQFSEVIFGEEDKIIILIAEKDLPIKKIQEIDEKAWEKAVEEEIKSLTGEK